MEINETLSLLVGIIGTGIAIYQWAIINEGKKRKNRLQYILAGIHASALQKQQAWNNQISLLPKPGTPEDMRIAQIHFRAKDDFTEIANSTSALEGVIDSENSAIVSMMDKYKTIVVKNVEIQKVANSARSEKQKPG